MTNNVHKIDCLEGMREMESCLVDTIITDPPYGLSFMGKGWDRGVPGMPFWEEALRVAKPGAMLMAFGGTRTFHRLACAIEDAGWEIRDTVMWVYGSGFPKSLDISKAIDKAMGAEREVLRMKNEGMGNTRGKCFNHQGSSRGVPVTAPSTEEAKRWSGYGTALKPAWEPITLAMKPLDGTFAQNAAKWGVAGLWVDGGRVLVDAEVDDSQLRTMRRAQRDEKKGWGINKNSGDTAQVIRRDGRFPANLIHDGSDEVLAEFPATKSGILAEHHVHTTSKTKNVFGERKALHTPTYGDFGLASRFFYCARASNAERNEGCGRDTPSVHASTNNHPTVKPLALMRYLCRLTRTPKGGLVLDPFAGSGTTGIAAFLEDRKFIGFEIEAKYAEIANRRIKYHMDKPRQGLLF